MALLQLHETKRSLSRHALHRVTGQVNSLLVMFCCVGQVTTVAEKMAKRNMQSKLL
jgi:hypothetical protein